MFIGLQILRAKIRGFHAAGLSLRNRIRRASGAKRNELWNEKRSLGNHNREHLIAYGLLRGVSYERIESCAKENKPNPARIFELLHAHGNFEHRREFTIEKIETLLTPSGAPPRISPPPVRPEATSSRPSQGLLVRARRLLEKGLGS